MLRYAVVAAGLVALACAAADDKDPVKERLFAAKVAYDKEMSAHRRAATDWLDKREETARKAGDKKALDAVKGDRAAFEEDGLLPKTAPADIQQKRDKARKALDAAYAQAVKDYTKAKKDDEAAAMETEWKSFAKATSGVVDLLELIDPKAHAVFGEWARDGNALVATAPAGSVAQLQIPYEPGDEYDVELAFKRLKGDGCLGVILVAGGRQVLVQLDGWAGRGYGTGFEFIDKVHMLDHKTTVKGRLMKADKSYTLGCAVRSGKIDLTLDAKPVTSFKGEFSSLSLYGDYRRPNEKTLNLFAGNNASFKITRAVLTLVKGKGTVIK